MILVLSTLALDETTNQVIDWLDFYGSKWIRYNSTEDILDETPFFLKISAKDNQQIIKINKKPFNLENINAIWYRRRGIPFLDTLSLIKDYNLRSSIEEYMKNEINSYSIATFHLLWDKNWLGNPFNSSVNKLLSLKTAERAGLDIPETIITNDKNELLNFYYSHSKIVIKPIRDSMPFYKDGKTYSLYTEILELETIDKTKEFFFPILAQENIEKDYELRIFYLDDEIFSMAIFSQGDIKTEVDFRKYNFEKWNRCVPYNLPNQISEQIKTFMSKMEMNTGSIDMIVTKDKRYVFLEINPVGQFGMVSFPCNYYLEKKVAEKLIQWDKTENGQ